jgi:hypothetical protein
LAAEEEVRAVDNGEGKSSSLLRAITGSHDGTIWLAEQVLASLDRDEANTVLKGIVNLELAVIRGSFGVTTNRAIVTNVPVLAGVAVKEDSAIRVDVELETFLVGSITLLVSLDLRTVTCGDVLTTVVLDGELWLGVLDLKDALLGVRVGLGLESTKSTITAYVVTRLCLKGNLSSNKAQEELAALVLLSDKLAVSLEVGALA